MSWLAIIAALLPLLLKLLEWLTDRKELTERQQKKVNRIIGVTNKIRARAVRLGCRSEGSDGEEED